MYVLPCVSVVTMGYHVIPMNLCIGVGTRFHRDSPVEALGHSLRSFVKEICPRGNNKVIIYFLIS